MKASAQLTTGWRWLVLGSGVVGLVCCAFLPLRAQTNRPAPAQSFVVRNFVLPEYYEKTATGSGTNLLRALVVGKEGIPQGKEQFLVKSMRLEHYHQDGRTNLVARSPECIVDPNRREVYSSQHVEAEGGGGALFIEGDGFLCRLTNVHLVISNNVRTVIRR